MRFSLSILILLLLPGAIMAHGVDGHPFVAGLTHPIFGIDHLLAIVGITLIGHHLMDEKPWLPSILFIIAMAIGGFLGSTADPINITELVIQASVIICGIIIWGQLRLTLVGFALLGIIFGFFHGHAHGTEMPIDSPIHIYIIGYVLGATLLSLVGYLIAKLFTSGLGIRTLGAFIAGMGTAMLLV